jgi:peptidoglycan/xylan/chitin deacetylase (PgdA/CDA1 family)
VATSAQVAAFTFDDGPDPVATPEVLATLARHGARATFFVLGDRARQHPDLLDAIIDGGHALGSHGWDHSSLLLDAPTWRSRRWRRRQIRAGVESLGGRGCGLFRPPFGHHDLRCRLAASSAGVETVGWTFAAGDWLGETSDEIVANVRQELVPGSIVLWHDALTDAYDPAYFDRTASLAALDEVLRCEDGYRFVTVPELVGLGTSHRRYRAMRPAPDRPSHRANDAV